jgi:hypothetical protein
MSGKVKRVGLAAAAVVLATLLVPVQGAYAADGCGEGWFKQSDGYLTKDALWQGLGAHNAWVYHSGRVRFCTDNDTFNNDENRRALIGYPSADYPFQSEIRKNGPYARFCVRQVIEAHMTGITTSTSWSIGGSFSKSDPEVSWSYSSTSNSLTARVAKNAECGPDVNRILARTSGITVTAENDSGRIPWVRLITNISAHYRFQGAKVSDNFTLSEYDNS